MSLLGSFSGSEEADFKVGDWWVRPRRNELERRESSVHVEARSMAVLVCLARHAPRAVSKDRLLGEVWSDSPYIGDDVISHAIWELRKGLGDSAKEPTYIQTIPRKGYRLLAEVLRPQGAAVPIEGAMIDHYEIQEELGRGSMGIVYKAMDQRLHRPVAIKFLAPDLTRDEKACRRFKREAELAASLNHPHLATVHEIGETAQGQRYLVTPHYGGGSLKERLLQGPLSSQEASRMARQLAAGLGAAHQRGIVHRDIKPANLLLDDHGTLKVADFGIAKLQGGTDLTRTGASLGTPAYKSPEQSRGDPVDQRTDVWSLGVVLFEMVVGRRPFDGEYEQAVVHSILSDAPQALESADGQPVPEHLRRVIAKAMAKDPADRYQSAEEMAADLDGADAARASSSGVSFSQRGGNWVWWLVGMVAVSVLLLFLGRNDSVQNEKEASPPKGGIEAQEVPKGAMTHVSQGRTSWLRGSDQRNLERAENHLEEAVRLAPSWERAGALLALFKVEHFFSTQKEEDRDRAVELIAQTFDIDPNSTLALVAQARLILLELSPEEEKKKRELSQAEDFLTRALELQPQCEAGEDCDFAYVFLAELYWYQGREEAAFQILESGMDQGMGHVRCLLKKAQLYGASSKSILAIVAYESVLEEWDADQTTALNELGAILIRTNQYEKAVERLLRAFELTNDPRTALNLGDAFYGQKNWRRAEKWFLAAEDLYLENGQPSPLPAVALGDTFWEQRQVERARTWYQKALDRFDVMMAQPAGLGTRRRAQRAACLAKLSRFEEAENQVNQVLAEASEWNGGLVYAARIQALKGDREALFRIARQAVEARVEPHRLKDDAAFLEFREDPEYLDILNALE
ncbi:MAG: protein kinase [Deltaproteobacteria bacterium]|nr:protein kinase [Deltaproteobacteria bacterium]